MSDTSYLSLLPEDILDIIVSKLSIRDRKNVILSLSKYYEPEMKKIKVLTISESNRHQKYNIHLNSDIDETEMTIIKTLLKYYYINKNYFDPLYYDENIKLYSTNNIGLSIQIKNDFLILTIDGIKIELWIHENIEGIFDEITNMEMVYDKLWFIAKLIADEKVSCINIYNYNNYEISVHYIYNQSKIVDTYNFEFIMRKVYMDEI